MKKRVHVYYNGRVQGVGFRYTAEYIAQDMDVTGWAKNLHDGRVELIAEGDEDVLKDFLSRVRSRLRTYIFDEDIKWQEGSGEFRDFGIRF